MWLEWDTSFLRRARQVLFPMPSELKQATHSMRNAITRKMKPAALSNRQIPRPAQLLLAALLMAFPAQLLADGFSRSALESPIVRADDYYLGRGDINNVRTGLDILQRVVSQSPKDYEAWWRIAKFQNYLARHASGAQEKRMFQAAIQAGKKAVALNPQRVEGHFWLGASYGLLADDANVVEAMRLVDSIRQEMETAARIDPNYEDGNALVTLGRLDYRLPFFKGGDRDQSVRILEDCVRRSPDNTLAMLYLADSYRAVGRQADARRMLERIVSLCPDPNYVPETKENQDDAREELNKYFHASR